MHARVIRAEIKKSKSRHLACPTQRNVTSNKKNLHTHTESFLCVFACVQCNIFSASVENVKAAAATGAERIENSNGSIITAPGGRGYNEAPRFEI